MNAYHVARMTAQFVRGRDARATPMRRRKDWAPGQANPSPTRE